MTNTNYPGNDLSKYSDKEVSNSPSISEDIESSGNFDDLDFNTQLPQKDLVQVDSNENIDEFFNNIKLEDLSDETSTKTETKTPTEDTPKDNTEMTSIPKSKIDLIQKLLKNITESSEKVNKLLSGGLSKEEEERISIAQIGEVGLLEEDDSDNKVIEGVFDGESMIGPDGKQYSIPANYASKSKLVEGDMMKLTITPKGTFIYKQIGPIDRDRITGTIELNQNGNFIVKNDDKIWKVLTASVTYYKGQAGDEAIILVPKNGESQWAAIDNIIKQTI